MNHGPDALPESVRIRILPEKVKTVAPNIHNPAHEFVRKPAATSRGQ